MGLLNYINFIKIQQNIKKNKNKKDNLKLKMTKGDKVNCGTCDKTYIDGNTGPGCPSHLRNNPDHIVPKNEVPTNSAVTVAEHTNKRK